MDRFHKKPTKTIPDKDSEVKTTKLFATTRHLKANVHSDSVSTSATPKKNVTEIKPFTLSHTNKNKGFSGIRKKSKTLIDIHSNNGDCISISGSGNTITRPSTSRIPSRESPRATLVGLKNHKVGEVPKYLMKDRVTVDFTLTSKKKHLVGLKKKLIDTQTEFLNGYKALQDAQMKANKVMGKEANKDFQIEQINMVAVINDGGKYLMVHDEDKISETKTKIPMTSDFQDKIVKISDHGFKLCREIITKFGQTHNDALKAGDMHSLDKNFTDVLKKMEDKIESDQKAHLSLMQETLKNAVASSNSPTLPPPPPPPPPQTIPTQITTTEQMEQLSMLKNTLESYKLKCENFESQIHKMAAKESELYKDVKEKDSLIFSKDKDVTRLRSISQSLEEHKAAIENKNEFLEKKLESKEQEMKRIQKDFEIAQKKIKVYEDSMNESKREKEKLLGYITREEEVNKLYDIQIKKNERLEFELQKSQHEVEMIKHEFETFKNTAALGSGDRSRHDDPLWNELQTLKAAFEKLSSEKDYIEKQKNTLEKAMENNVSDSLRVELSDANKEIMHIQKINEELRDSLIKLEQTTHKKETLIAELEQKLHSNTFVATSTKDLLNEVNVLRESESEKKRQIDDLKCELSKCHMEIKQQQETIFMHQRLLRIRSELINSLQEKEVSTRTRMDDLFNEVNKKSAQVSQTSDQFQMNHEMTAKAEELQNLFSTLGTKQMELSRQEHIIQKLEENNERNQRLRVKQEEKIARLENEISELKNVICLYQEKETEPFIDFKKINAQFLEAKSRNDLLLTSSRDIFDNERRKKRQTQIEVKQIKK